MKSTSNHEASKPEVTATEGIHVHVHKHEAPRDVVSQVDFAMFGFPHRAAMLDYATRNGVPFTASGNLRLFARVDIVEAVERNKKTRVRRLPPAVLSDDELARKAGLRIVPKAGAK